MRFSAQPLEIRKTKRRLRDLKLPPRLALVSSELLAVDSARTIDRLRLQGSQRRSFGAIGWGRSTAITFMAKNRSSLEPRSDTHSMQLIARRRRAN
jgi:hypothetical protein